MEARPSPFGSLMTTIEEPILASGAPERLRGLRADQKKYAALNAHGETHKIDIQQAFNIPLLDLLGDWYRLRKASELALNWISPERLRLYQCVIAAFSAAAPLEDTGIQGRFAGLIRMLERYITGLPSRHFSINLRTGRITAQ